MSEDTRIPIVRDLIADHVRSPSMKHIRDPYALNKLASQIVRRLDGSNPVWRKWNGPREAVLRSAAACWIPVEDMRDHLNSMTGPILTTTDIAQRLTTPPQRKISPSSVACRILEDLLLKRQVDNQSPIGSRVASRLHLRSRQNLTLKLPLTPLSVT